MFRRNAPLVQLTSREQLTAGQLPRRLVQLVIGLALYGASMAMMIHASLGLMPWDVFHQGVAQRVPLSFGEVTIAVGLLVLLAWIPLRQWPGLGTIANVVVIGVAVDATLSVLPSPDSLWARGGLLVAGIVANGVASALYIGSQLGPGPRDGLMTGISFRSGRSIRLVRTSIEVAVVVLGWLLGGTLGVGTVLYALAIGPLVQVFLPMVTVRLSAPDRSAQAAADGVPG